MLSVSNLLKLTCLFLAITLFVASQVEARSFFRPNKPVIHQAVKDGDMKKVIQLLQSGIDVNVKDDAGVVGHYPHLYGRTPLHVAAVYGKTQIARLLLEYGANPNKFDDDSESPLTLAAWKGNLSLVKILVAAGARINYLNPEDRFSGSNTALYTAVNNGHFDIVKYLIDKKADVNLACNDGNLPLHEAALRAQLDMVKLLLKHGADVNAVIFDNNTALHETMKDYVSMFEIKNRDTKSMWKAKLKIAQLLVQKGAKPNASRKDGKSALDLAREIDDVDVRNKMLKILSKN